MLKLPGDKSSTQQIEEIIRVNHAGEYGAKRIYEGQLAIFKNKPVSNTIKHMQEQELVHLNYFEQQLAKRRIRPSLLHPFWHMAGFALGAATALMGEKAAMACTVAVEEAIDEHYASQLDLLDQSETELKEQIIKFRAEELEHKNTAIDNDAHLAFAYPILSNVIKAGCKLAINLAKKL